MSSPAGTPRPAPANHSRAASSRKVTGLYKREYATLKVFANKWKISATFGLPLKQRAADSNASFGGHSTVFRPLRLQLVCLIFVISEDSVWSLRGIEPVGRNITSAREHEHCGAANCMARVRTSCSTMVRAGRDDVRGKPCPTWNLSSKGQYSA